MIRYVFYKVAGKAVRRGVGSLCFILISVWPVSSFGQLPSGMDASVKIDTLDLRDIDVKDAVKFIAQKGGLNIFAGENIQGRVTLYFEKLSPREALAHVLEALHLAYEETGGVIRVITDDEFRSRYGRSFSQSVATRLFSLRGMKAPTAAALLEKMKNPFGKIVSDEVSGTVFVEDTPEKIMEMDKYLVAVDHPVWTNIFPLRFIDAETTAGRLQAHLTPQMGSVQADKSSNRIFVTDTIEKLGEIKHLLGEMDLPRASMVIELSYAKADELAAVLRPVLTAGMGSIDVDKRLNQIVVIDTSEKLEELRTMVSRLDQKDREVFIEARIIQVVLKDEFRMGIDWEAVVERAHGLKLSSVWGGVGNSGKGSLAVGTLSDNNYHAIIEALGVTNKSRILSSPRIAVVNGHEARILVGSTKPYVTTTTTAPSSGPVTVAEDVKFIDVGVKLVVTPTIHNDGYITMKIRPEVSSATTSIRTGQNNSIPVVDTSEAETTVRIKDGVTIMIGGLIKDERSLADSRVPLLGDIPVVGSAFRNRSRTGEKSEIVIFLTPRIISGDVN